MSKTASDIDVPLLAYRFVRPANSRLVAYALASRMFNTRVPRSVLAREMGVSASAITHLLNRCAVRIPYTDLMSRVTAHLDAVAFERVDEAADGHAPDAATTSLEAFVENRLVGVKDFSEQVPQRWLFEAEDPDGARAIQTCTIGISLLRSVAALNAMNSRDRDRLVDNNLSEQFERVLPRLIEVAIGISPQQIRAEMILAKLGALAPAAVLPDVLNTARMNPDGFVLARVVRHMLRILRDPDDIPQLRGDDDYIRGHIWLHLSSLMRDGLPLDVYPARSLVLAAVRQHLIERRNDADRRIECARWIASCVADQGRPVRERMYAANICAEMLHRTVEEGSNPTTMEIRVEMRAGLDALSDSAGTDLGLRYASNVTHWITLLPTNEFFADDPRNTGVDRHFDAEGFEVGAYVSRRITATIGAPRSRAASAPHLQEATWRLAECALLTLDGVRRRTCLEAIAAAGFAGNVWKVFADIASDREAPRFLQEAATFGLAYLRHPRAEDVLLELAGRGGVTVPRDPSVRHAALIGLSELPTHNVDTVRERACRLHKLLADLQDEPDDPRDVRRAAVRALTNSDQSLASRSGDDLAPQRRVATDEYHATLSRLDADPVCAYYISDRLGASVR